MRVVAVALELQHAVDEMLEHARPGDRAVLGDVPDEERRDAGLLRDPQQPRRRLAHLRDRARRRADLLRPERLHRVDHADGGPLALERGAHGVELRLGEDLDVVAAAEPRRPELHLRDRLLTGHEQRATVARDRAERGQQQRRLADSRLAADEHERRGHEPAAEHAVELGHAGRDPVGLLGHDVDEPQRLTRLRRACGAARSRRAAAGPRPPSSRTRRSRGSGRASGRTSCRTRCTHAELPLPSPPRHRRRSGRRHGWQLRDDLSPACRPRTDRFCRWRSSSGRSARCSSGAAALRRRGDRRRCSPRGGRRGAIDAIWRGEALGTLLWALELHELPPYDTPFATRAVVAVDASAAGCAPDDAEIELELDAARLWHWRARTTLLQATRRHRAARAVLDVRAAGRRDRDARLRAGRPAEPAARRFPRVRQGLPAALRDRARRGALDRLRAAPRARLALRSRSSRGTTSRSTPDRAFSIIAAMERIDRYADLIVRVGANVQPGQTVFVDAAIDHADLVRAVARSAYRAGARYVDARYVDPHVRKAFIDLAPEEMLTETPAWLLERVEALADGGALIMIAGEAEPELLAGSDPARVGKARPIAALTRQLRAQNDRTVAWTIAADPTAGQATLMFGEPDVERLWEAIAYTVRLDEPDPVQAWREHIDRLACALRPARRPGARRRPLPRARHRPHGRPAAGVALAGRRPRDGRQASSTSRTCRPRRSSPAPTGAAPKASSARRGRCAVGGTIVRDLEVAFAGGERRRRQGVDRGRRRSAASSTTDEFARPARRGRARRRHVARRPDRA